MEYLITYDEINALARPCSADPDIARKFIEEAQQCDLRMQLGDANYKTILENRDNPDYEFVLGGGYYDGCSGTKYIEGIRKALAYYAYSRIVKNTHIATRYGFVQKSGEYSQSAELSARQAASGEAASIADQFMAEILAYIRTKPDLFPDTCRKGIKNNRIRYKILGR